VFRSSCLPPSSVASIKAAKNPTEIFVFQISKKTALKVSTPTMPTKSETSPAISKGDVESSTVPINSHAVDDALPFLQSHGHVTLLNEEEENILVRKIDWMILPLLSVVAFLQFLDKSLRMFDCYSSAP
jgi:hypothetical protein